MSVLGHGFYIVLLAPYKDCEEDDGRYLLRHVDFRLSLLLEKTHLIFQRMLMFQSVAYFGSSSTSSSFLAVVASYLYYYLYLCSTIFLSTLPVC